MRRGGARGLGSGGGGGGSLGLRAWGGGSIFGFWVGALDFFWVDGSLKIGVNFFLFCFSRWV